MQPKQRRAHILKQLKRSDLYEWEREHMLQELHYIHAELITQRPRYSEGDPRPRCKQSKKHTSNKHSR